MWTDFERAQIDAALKSEQIGPVLDFWEAMVRAGGMPPMSPDHVRVVLMAFRRERGDPVQVRSDQYVGADGAPHNKEIGNAVVPEIPEFIGRAIMSAVKA